MLNELPGEIGNESAKVAYYKQSNFNPLADYKLQVHTRSFKEAKKLGDTSLNNDVRFDIMGISNEEEIYYSVERGDLKYCKLIESAANRKLLQTLTGSSLKVFLWIPYIIRYKGDIVELELNDMIKNGFKMAPLSFRESLAELESKRIIRRVGQIQKEADYWMFFINPQILFKGNSKEFYDGVLEYHPEYYELQKQRAAL